ncbi:MAG: primosomal protein N' [Nitrospinae bacterium]|nr:primosomal protein N' [Nitrospinota bacterium]
MNRFAEVVFGIPVDRVFLYRIPERMDTLCKKGVRVFAPFGRRNMIGYIVGFQNNVDIETKELIEIIDKEPVVPDYMGKFTRWIADYYLCSWGEVIESAMPEWVDIKIINKSELKRVKTRYREGSGNRDLGLKNSQKSSATGIQSLTPYQANALKKILDKVNKEIHHIFLLRGVTGSGKTEVYIRTASEVLKSGRKVIVMVPEIALTLQISQRFLTLNYSGRRIAIMHSNLTPRERYDEWMKIRNGEVDVVIGARSVIFAPFEDIGLIIVDEEHDTAYKQNENPRYNGRDAAVMRGKLSNAVVILGSATPSMESYYNAQIGKYEFVSLPERIDKKPLPVIEIVDTRGGAHGGKIISERLKTEIGKRIAKKEQTLLFLNRRGTARHIQCAECGFVWRCRNCSISLTYHKKENLGICHYCGYSVIISDSCPECKGYSIGYKGRGTQRIEEEIRSLFPDLNIERMDRDTVRKKGEAKRILKGVEMGDVDILIGTQIISKGHDYPGITLVGIISADDSLNIPDFRAAERTFQLITQVAGRAGRGEIKGDVILQTYNPDNYAVKCAKEYNFIEFYNREGKFREILNYPPYAKMALFIVSGRNEKIIEAVSHSLGEIFDEVIKRHRDLYQQNHNSIERFGPSKAIIYKIKNRYRWHIILKTKKTGDLKKIISKIIEEINSSSLLKKSIKMDIDVDPINFV